MHLEVDHGRGLLSIGVSFPLVSVRNCIPPIGAPNSNVCLMACSVNPPGTKLAAGHVEPHGLVAARDVEADRRGTDARLRSNDAADRHAIAEMTVRHQRKVVRHARTHARLIQRVGLVFSKDGYVVDDLHVLIEISFCPATEHSP